MLWEIAEWLSFFFIFLWFLVFIGGIIQGIGRFFNRQTYTSVDESVKLLYVDQRPDPTTPDFAQWAGARNAEQFLRRKG